PRRGPPTGDPRRCRRRFQSDRADQREDDHPRSSVSDTHPSMHAAGRTRPDRPAASYQPRRGQPGKLSMAPGIRCRKGFPSLQALPPKRQMTKETVPMKAIVVTDQAAGTAGMKLVERPEPQGAALASLSGANYGDVIVQVHASGFTG